MGNKEKAEYYALIVTIVIAAIVSILDLTGSLEEIKWLKDKISTITLLLLALIATSFLFSTQNTRQFLRSILPFGTIKKFNNINDTFKYIVKRIGMAQKIIYDITYPFLRTKEPMSYGKEEYEEYLNSIENVSKRILYHEIVFFQTKANTDKFKRLISKAGKYYQLSAYINQPIDSPLRLVFIIIDDEVIFLQGLAIKQTQVVKFLRNYYKKLWDEAIPIKLGQHVDSELLEKIEKNDIENVDEK